MAEVAVSLISSASCVESVAHTAHDDQKARQTIALKQKTRSEFDLSLQLDTGFLVSDSEPFRGIKLFPNESLLGAKPSIEQYAEEHDCSASRKHHFYHLLTRCINEKDLKSGKKVYSNIMKSGLESDSFLGCHLIRMFTVFEDLGKANDVFYKILEPSIFVWGAILMANVNLGNSKHAVELYFNLRKTALEPDGHVYVAALQACASLPSLVQAMEVHDHIIESGLECNVYVGNALIVMYSKCGKMEDAQFVFNRLSKQDAVSWNSLITAYGQFGHICKVLELFTGMLKEGFWPTYVSLTCCLNACSSIMEIEQGREMHFFFVRHGLDGEIEVGITLIEMYAKCRSLVDAKMVFDSLDYDLRACESMTKVYFQHERDHEVIKIFQSMRQKGVFPNVKTFICILRACASISDLERGWQVHSEIVECGFEYDVFVGNTLVDLYGKCGSVCDAKVVFERLQKRDVVSWSALISGFALHEHRIEAIAILRKMHEEGLKPNEITFACVLKACCVVACLEDGRWIHSLIIDSGLGNDVFIGSGLIDMYAKCGNLEDARVVMESLPEQDSVTWNALISSYADHGYGLEALQCFRMMQENVKEPSSGILVSALKACATVAAVEQGKQIHKQIVQKGFETDTFICTALIDMYAKCGLIEDASTVFRSLSDPDIVAWTTILTCFAQSNDYNSALKFFNDMEGARIQPNEVAFTCLLSACNHSGRLKEGCEHFKSMKEKYNMAPTLEHHYVLMEILSHEARFEEAEDLIECVPFTSNIVGWMSLLKSCQHHGNVKLGRRCFDHALEIKPEYSSAYVHMWNLYAQAGMWDHAKKIDDLRITANARKKPAKAFIEVNKQVYSFIGADKTHPQSDQIYKKLKTLIEKIKDEGYSPSVDAVPEWSSDRDKEASLCRHSEKLAIAFGLISTAKGSTIRLSKNLHVCADCHSAAKAISKVEMRQIVISDSYQIHRFKDGSCSCGR